MGIDTAEYVGPGWAAWGGEGWSWGLQASALDTCKNRSLFWPRLFQAHGEGEPEKKEVSELRSELWEKEMKLTDIRLEALNSAHQLEQLRETMHNMQVRTTARSPSGSEHPGGHSHCSPTAVLQPWDAAGVQLLTLCCNWFSPAGGGSPEG